jgi:hypothetical protein
MANLTLADLQNEVYAHTGIASTDTDTNGTTMSANVLRWLNYVQQDIQSRWPWPWAYGREAVATIPDYTTGTVSVSASGTTVTGASTAWTTTHGDGTYFIQFAGSNDWYRVSARVSTTSLTLEIAFQGTANLSAVTYILRKFLYSTSSTADEIIDVRNWGTPIKLIQCDLRTIDLINPMVQSTSPGYAYLMFGTDASGNLQFIPYPFPNDQRLFEFRTKKRPTDFVLTTDSPSIPNKYAHVIAWGGIALGFAYLRKFEEANAWNAKVEARINQMKAEYRQSEDMQNVLGSIDTISRSRWIQFPASYPSIS